MLEELHRLVESGRLDPRWFADLIEYETWFRIWGHTHSEDGGPRAAVAADLIQRLQRARQAVASPSLYELRRFAGVGLVRAALLRYLIPRDPDASVRRHELFGSPLVRKLVMGTVGRLSRSGGGGNYRLGQGRSPSEAVTRFALRGSVFNEVWHILAAFFAARSAIADAVVGQFGPGFVIGAVAVVVNLGLVALQRYNRARMVRAANRFLARGLGYPSVYRNWAGLDQRALRRYHTQATTSPSPLSWVARLIVTLNAATALVGRVLRPARSPSVLARAELDRIVAGSGLDRRQRRQVRRVIEQAEERYWGKRITDGQTGFHIAREVERLAGAAVQAGIQVDGATLVELAARDVRWHPALDRFTARTNPTGHRIKTAAIANLLARAPPELRDALLGQWTIDTPDRGRVETEDGGSPAVEGVDGAASHPGRDDSQGFRTGGPLAVLSDKEIEFALQAFAAVRQASVDVPENAVHQVRIRGPPRGLRSGEELFSPSPEAVADALRELRASPQQVARILEAWAFSWRDQASGTVVFAVFEPRQVVLEQSGLWEEVLQHERRHVEGGFAGDDEHAAHVRELTGRIDRAVAAGLGATVVDPGPERLRSRWSTGLADMRLVRCGPRSSSATTTTWLAR